MGGHRTGTAHRAESSLRRHLHRSGSLTSVGRTDQHRTRRPPAARRGTAVLALLVLLVATVTTGPPAAAGPADPKVITYTVSTAGRTHADRNEFAAHVAATLAHPEGWSLGGAISFRSVASGADMRILLTEPAVLGAIPGCSSTWSCRVGPDVYINEDRWMRATPTWTLGRDAYRRYVVNHEVGHFLGFGHQGCPGAGRDAPVMMQQSKGSAPCRDRVWPLSSEREGLAARYGVQIREATAASRARVARAHLAVLQRWPDPGELHEGAMALDEGTLNGDRLVHGLFRSREFQAVPGLVARLYQSAFARAPDPEGLLYWGARIQQGTPPRSVADQFAGSSEFLARHDTSDHTAFVELVYRNVLGRSSDPAGRRWWTDRLAAGTLSRGDLLLGFSESTEHRAATQNRTFATVAYATVLGVTPDPDGLVYWVTRLDTGTPLRDLLAHFRSRDHARL